MWKSIVEWFVKMAWPQIQKLLLKALNEVLEWLYDELAKWLKKGGEEQANKFDAKAKEAEKKATQTDDEAEANKYRTEARIWREALYMYIHEYEKLASEMGKIMSDGASKMFETADSLNVDDVFDKSTDRMSLKTGLVIFPSLLPSEEKEKTSQGPETTE